MDTDLVLTVGVVLLVLSLPSLMSAWVEGRFPRVGFVMLTAALAMILTAHLYRPGGYRLDELPGAVLNVLARALP